MIDIYLTDRAILTPSAGVDQWGTPLPTTSRTIYCKFNWGTKLVRNNLGEQVVSSATVLMNENPGHTSSIQYDGVDYAIIAIQRPKSFSEQYYRVYLA